MPRRNRFGSFAPFVLPLLAMVMLASSPPAGAELQVTAVGRHFAGLPALLLLHGELPGVRILSIDPPLIRPRPESQSDVIELRVRTVAAPLAPTAVFDQGVEFPQLGSGNSSLIVEVFDENGLRTELLHRSVRPDPPLTIAASRDVVPANESFTVRASFTANTGSFHPGWRREGSRIRLDLFISCHICPVVIPSEPHQVESEPIGPLPPGEYTLEVWDRPDGSHQLLHRQKIFVVPDPVELQDGRFEVEVLLDPPHRGKARLVRPPSRDAALFYFFDPANWEMMIKVLDGCAINGHFWVFGAASTDVGFAVTLRDRLGGAPREYRHAAGSPAPAIADIAAFACTASAAGEAR